MENEARIREFAQSYKRLLREYPDDPKVVYLASCIRSARKDYGQCEYIHDATATARTLWKLGLSVICPAMNTAHLDGTDIPDSVWLKGDFAQIRRCDAIIMHANWESSAGAKEELIVAQNHGVREFFLPEDHRKLAAWAKKPRDMLLTHRGTGAIRKYSLYQTQE